MAVRHAPTSTDRLLGAPPPHLLAGEDGGNLVALASRQPLPTEAIAEALTDRDLVWRVAEGDALADFVGDADVLTDDHAPVDQLLTPYG